MIVPSNGLQYFLLLANIVQCSVTVQVTLDSVWTLCDTPASHQSTSTTCSWTQRNQVLGVYYCKFSAIMLPHSYCKPQYSFPTQQEVIDFAVKKSREALSRNSDTVVVSGTYTIGKERVFLALAEALGSKICVTKQKERILRCLLWPRLESLLTTDPLSATVHVLPMKKLNIEV